MARDLTEEELADLRPPAPARPRWAIVELLGHRRLYGLVSEVEMASGTFFRVDVQDLVVEPSAPIKIVGEERWVRQPGFALPGFSVTVGSTAVYAITTPMGTPEEAEEAVRARLQVDLPAVLRAWPFPVPSFDHEPCEPPPADQRDPDDDVEMPL